jgi:hypothetical protein
MTGAGRGRADRRQPEPAEADDHARPCHLVLLVGKPRQVDRLALVAGGRARKGETLYVPMPDKTIAVEVTDMVFFDKEGGRING